MQVLELLVASLGFVSSISAILFKLNRIMRYLYKQEKDIDLLKQQIKDLQKDKK